MQRFSVQWIGLRQITENNIYFGAIQFISHTGGHCQRAGAHNCTGVEAGSNLVQLFGQTTGRALLRNIIQPDEVIYRFSLKYCKLHNT